VSIRIIAVGKRHEAWVQPGVERYEKRLRKPFDVEWVLLPHSALEDRQARQDESERIFERIGPHDFVLLCDERGRQVDSPALSKLLQASIDAARRIVVVIGGAYGVNEQLQARADFVLSFSPLVFPHQLVRLMIIEQVYRAQEIAAGRPYHHS
jgi:23S rRNA (pseudouridine1915-N3)-methyltransferase